MKTATKPFMQFNDLVSSCSEQAQKATNERAQAGNFAPLALCYMPATTENNGQLMLIPDGDDLPAGFIKSNAPLLNMGVPYSSYWAWIHKHSVILPILAPA